MARYRMKSGCLRSMSTLSSSSTDFSDSGIGGAGSIEAKSLEYVVSQIEDK